MPKKGYKPTEEHKANIGHGVRNSEKYQRAMKSEEYRASIRADKERALKISKSNTGKIRSEEAKIKYSLSKLGDNNPAKRPEVRKKISQTLTGKTHSNETKLKMSIAHKGRKNSEEANKKNSLSKLGNKWNVGRKHSQETKLKLSKANKGKKASKESKEKMSNAQKGERSYRWKGGVSFLPYCSKFNGRKKEEIRNKYNRKCYICGKDEKDNITTTGKKWKLSIHHIDEDKEQGCKGKQWNLVPVCLMCHNKMHKDKEIVELLMSKSTVIDAIMDGKEAPELNLLMNLVSHFNIDIDRANREMEKI